MKQNRLEGVLRRNRKHVALDLALAAFFLMALLFSGLAFGSELPKLSSAPAQMAQVADTNAPVAFTAEEASPRLAHR